MNELQNVFDFEGSEIRTVKNGQDIFFVAKDICEVLDHSDVSVAVSRLDDDEKLIQTLFVSGQNRKTWLINESGLYSLILTSRKPEAKQFKRWITHEVIPSIRKHGAYMTAETIEEALLNPDTIIRIATELKEERSKRIIAETKINEEKPYTDFGKVVAISDGAINVGAFAKLIYEKHGINIGRNKLMEWLREKGYLIKQGREKNNPKQNYIEQGLFKVSPTIISRTEGDVQSSTTLVTGKGQVKLMEILKQEFRSEVFQ